MGLTSSSIFTCDTSGSERLVAVFLGFTVDDSPEISIMTQSSVSPISALQFSPSIEKNTSHFFGWQNIEAIEWE
jgi:hypothetical protein